MELQEETFVKMHGFKATGDTHGGSVSYVAFAHMAMTLLHT